MRPVVDHVPYAVRDLDEAIARFERVGLAPMYGGTHGDGATEMALVPLPDGTYVELIAATGEGEPGFWPAAIEAGDGPCAWCVQTGSVHTELQRFITHDVRVDGPQRASRDRPDGTHVEWDMGFLGSDEREVLPFLIADRTPREYRVPDSELYGSPLSGVGWVVIAVRDLASAIEQFARLYRLPEPETDVDTHFGEMAWFPEQAFVLAEPTDEPLLDRLESSGPGPAALFLSAEMDRATDQFPLTGGRSLFDRRLAFFEGFDHQLGVVSRR
ncbi:NAD(P)H-hydrate repair enzyme Nnr, NAD(P)H-hydrate epimerase domain [Halanaeroarchaeum sp. HSR-CO]|uniref:VOC family protein n=1 Tax=Halanaeroarchaeum sp. HSR-CO TaxID=2866382 RepID=UPI00217E1904|nr:VOC family protein [Halanaeroarchaeum sp. HSR-CO]UWG48266.1 NAD(P)H-hydrate repair enzyme Nnr, NAD(P)H-hydrate epimerase domain [Halanaeroarchaeum sp. HSR-CO]